MAGQPVSVGLVLDNGFRLFREHWRALLPVSIVASVVGQVLQGALELQSPGQGQAPGLPGPDLWVAIAVFWLLSFVTFAMVILAIDDCANGQEPSVTGTLARAAARLAALLGATVLLVLAFMGGTLLLIVPGLYLLVALSQSWYCVLLDGAGPVQSLRDSRALVRGVWWRTSLLLFVAGLVNFLAVGLPALLLGAGGELLGVGGDATSVGTWTLLVAIAVVTAPLVPLGPALFYVIYRELQTRMQGDDLRARLETAAP